AVSAFEFATMQNPFSVTGTPDGGHLSIMQQSYFINRVGFALWEAAMLALAWLFPAASAEVCFGALGLPLVVAVAVKAQAPAAAGPARLEALDDLGEEGPRPGGEPASCGVPSRAGGAAAAAVQV
ncbi:unnamed protein product, partial [Prorocentrum cordatum]